MKIPHTELSQNTLISVLEEFITREGTDYGVEDYSLEEKVEQLLKQLESGDIYINFDAESQSCSVVSSHAD